MFQYLPQVLSVAARIYCETLYLILHGRIETLNARELRLLVLVFGIPLQYELLNCGFRVYTKDKIEIQHSDRNIMLSLAK